MERHVNLRARLAPSWGGLGYRLFVARDTFAPGLKVEILTGFEFRETEEGAPYSQDDGVAVDDDFIRSLVNEAARYGIRADSDAALDGSRKDHIKDLREITSSLLSKVKDANAPR